MKKLLLLSLIAVLGLSSFSAYSQTGFTCATPIQITALPYATTDNTANYGDTTDIIQPPGCGGTTGNYMTGNDVFYTFTSQITGTVTIKLTPGANYSGIFVYSSCANVGVSCLAGIGDTGSSVRQIPLAVTAGQSYFIVISSFATPQTFSYGLEIQTTSCSAPTQLAATGITQNSAVLYWSNSGTASSFEVSVQTNPNIPTGSGIPTSNTTYQATGLLPQSVYYGYVRSDCGNGAFSTWAGPYVFTTPPSTASCLAPTQLTSAGISSTSVNLYWSNPGSAAAWEVSIQPVGASQPSGAGIPASSSPYQVTGLTAQTGYQAWVRADCGNGTFSAWTGPYIFTTMAPPANCLAPTAVTVTAVTQNSASVIWTGSTGSSAWEVVVQPSGLGTPTGSGTTAVNYTYSATGLTAATVYQAYVRTDCGDGTFSAWSTAYTFTTVTAPPVCGGNFIDNGGISANYSNNSDSTVTICPTNPGDYVTVTFNSFDTEANWDGLYVFNGSSIASPQISSGNQAGNIPGGMPGSYFGTTIPGPFMSTDPSGCLTFRFRSDGSVTNAGWNATITCSPIPNCPQPTAVAVSNLPNSSASISWNEQGVATQWEILILPTGSPAPTPSATGIIVNSNPYVATNLASLSTYKIYVRAICSATEKSFWSGPTTYTPSCITPTNLSVSGVTANGASVSWSNIGGLASQWEVVVVPAGAPAPTASTVGTIATTNPFILSGLTSGSTYDVYVRAICSTSFSSPYGGPATFVTVLVTPPLCGGNYTDNGGLYNNYMNNSDDTITIYPNNPGDQVTVTFSAFDTEANWDGLYVFNGNSTASPQIASANPASNVPGALSGAFWGTTIPGPFTSTDPSGALTFRFRSDPSVTKAGWNATVECLPLSNCPTCPDKILMYAFIDANGNGIKDITEVYFSNGQFIYQQNNAGNIFNVSSPYGSFPLYDSNPVNTYDLSYQINPEYTPYYAISPTNYNDVNIPVGSGTQVFYFPITLTQGYNDVTVSVIPVNPPRPGFSYTNKIVYSNLGVAATSGTLSFTKDNLVSITGSSQAGTVNIANGFSYDFVNLLPSETRLIFVNMTVPTIPTVNLGDILTNSATISAPANDINLLNNSSSNSQIVVGSYDPNDKMEAHGGKIRFDNFTQGEYLFYTIRFQNTGTAAATNVRLEDLLDAQLDEETIRMVSSSHNYIMERIGSQIIWKFDNIQLPGELQDEEHSKGYVYFKIKLKPGFTVGDIVPNTAKIYFDSNPAIVTNTCNTEFVSQLSVSSFDTRNIDIYPNPANGAFRIQLANTTESLESVLIYNVLGKCVKTQKNISASQSEIDISGISKGVYMVEITTTNNFKLVKKLIIK